MLPFFWSFISYIKFTQFPHVFISCSQVLTAPWPLHASSFFTLELKMQENAGKTGGKTGGMTLGKCSSF